MHTPIPADLGLRVREFKSRQPDITRADLRHSDVKDGLVIRVETTARHRRVLMASTLEEVQLGAGIGHPRHDKFRGLA